MTETKQDVFDEVLGAFDEAVSEQPGALHPTNQIICYADRYAAATDETEAENQRHADQVMPVVTKEGFNKLFTKDELYQMGVEMGMIDDETEAQRGCPYCHEPHRVIPTDDELNYSGDPSNFLRIGMTGGDDWSGIPPNPTSGAEIHTVTPVGYENAEVDETITIKYCPMCGRRLEGEDE